MDPSHSSRFRYLHGEIHHKPRYSRYPRWVGIGTQDQPNEEEARIFKVLVGRNALNFHAPSFAVDIVLTSDSNKTPRARVQRLLEQEDAFPLGKAITSIMPPAITADEPVASPSDRSRRALLLVGSPKISSPSTSGVLGGYLLKQLEERGWETVFLTLLPTLLKDKGRAERLAAANKADLILLAFPLYIDSLPFLLMRALETMAQQPQDESGISQKGLVAIVNNGFTEAYQNAVAVAICRQFAISTNMTWLGGLAMGGGEALFRGQPFEQTKRNGPPVVHVQRALDLAASALAGGWPIPDAAIKLIKKSPILMLPFRWWRRLFIKVANEHWRRGAAEHQIDSEAMQARPYAWAVHTSSVP